MPIINNKYLENKRTELLHIQSGSIIITDAPLDNNGKGEYFSPTDTVAGALSACMMTIMGIKAEKDNFDLQGLKSTVTKLMTSDPRRISGIKIVFEWADCELTESQKITLKEAALTCPVALSIHPDIKQNITFNF